MADVKFTPGPWRADVGADDTQIVVPREKHIRLGVEGEWTLARLDHFEWDFDEDEIARCELKANAHLIAASPDLYEALKLLRGCVSTVLTPFEATNAADAALAKARGES
jgi:hypothetical protein